MTDEVSRQDRIEEAPGAARVAAASDVVVVAGGRARP